MKDAGPRHPPYTPPPGLSPTLRARDRPCGGGDDPGSPGPQIWSQRVVYAMVVQHLRHSTCARFEALVRGTYVGHLTTFDRTLDDHVFFSSLHVNAEFRGHGIGGTLLDQGVAYYPGRVLRLMAVPFGYPNDKLQLDRAELEAFYCRRGFRHEPGGGTTAISRRLMVRNPLTPRIRKGTS